MRRNVRCSNCPESPCNHWSCPKSDPVADILFAYGCTDCSGIFDIEDKNEYGSWTYTCIDCGTQYIHDPRRLVKGLSLLNLIVKKGEKDE